MKKNNVADIENKEPKTTNRKSSNVREYFTKEVNDQINEMSVPEMQSLMKAMISSREWISVLKYTSMRMMLLDGTLRATDPVKDPSKISWSQGAMAGLCDIENYIIDLNAKVVEEEKESEEPTQ